MRWWCWWAAAAAAAAGARARAGNRRQRRALGARCGGNQDLFNVSSNPGRGWKKKFFLEKSMEIFFFGSKRVGDNGWKSVSWGFGWEVFFGLEAIDRSIEFGSV